MRYAFFMIACLIALATVSTGRAADQPQSLVVASPLPAAPPNIVVNPLPSATSGSREFGPNYEFYVPIEIKSDVPGIVRSWDPAAHPGNGVHMTSEGLACNSDADCQAPLGCFNRADSGQIPQSLCAIPSGH